MTEIEESPRLGNGRVSLRALRADDRPSVVKALNDELAHRFLFRPPFPYKESDFDEFLGVARRPTAETLLVYWVITAAADDAWLGGISLSLDPERETGELGYVLAPWARGRGLATAAARLVRDWAFDDLGLARLEVHAEVKNIASQRLAESVGFRREGLLRSYLPVRGVRRDFVAYGMLAGDQRL